MVVAKLSVSFAEETRDEVKAAALRAGVPVSTWIEEAARERLRAEAFDEFIAAWQDEHGPLTHDELSSAGKRVTELFGPEPST